MRTPILFLVLAFGLTALAPALAQECVPSTSPTLVDTGVAPGPRYYVAEDPYWLLCPFGFPECGGIWIYRESNGIDGLQRQDEYWDDTCGGVIPGDTVVF